ncbi:MAG: PD-(D/E)XK nuclease family protein [Verrucomicrobiales bacterium]|nr:PD-(D/E)XK nuclease family protein [Verrucomicrobiales bacterium]
MPFPSQPLRPRFLLGPAGSGKTHRCLAEIRSELARSPIGPPLLLLAPKQATYQLERQLLETAELKGWSRLQILSFERLAMQVLDNTEHPAREILREEGRVMVLRALLRRHQSQLRVFHASARLGGFAQDLSEILRELQRHGCAPQRLRDLARQSESDTSLSDKLRDLALLLGAYQDWLRDHGMLDADLLPDLATDALRQRNSSYHLEALWLDGFAEMTPQEIELLTAVTACSERATLAFCLDSADADQAPWYSPWAIVGQTFRQLHRRLTTEFGPDIALEILPRQSDGGRFHRQPLLGAIEEGWAAGRGTPRPIADRAPSALRLVECENIEREAEVAARTILREVRAGCRYRDLAVLTRSLDGCHAAIERVFTRYDLPYFVDRRAPLSHHPLAELSRSCLRLAAFRWQHEDWFGALKTGLAPIPIDAVDRWENRSLELGWTPLDWRRALGAPSTSPEARTAAEFAEELRVVFSGLEPLVDAVSGSPDASTLTRSLRKLWLAWGVHEQLERWDDIAASENAGEPSHLAAEEQLSLWLSDLERGFAGESMALADWLPIIEAGLATLTAGIIPPTLDQVLVGAIDRSRQPELRTAIVMGLNEGQFPAPPPQARLLTEAEREHLLGWGLRLSPDRLRRLGHERYYAYIALTRAHEKLVLTWSRRDDTGKAQSPSPYLRSLQQLIGGWPIETDDCENPDPRNLGSDLAHRVEHWTELLPRMLLCPESSGIAPWLDEVETASVWERFRPHPTSEPLSPDVVASLIGAEPEVSVSALESYASCPFQFLVNHALRGKERRELEVDARQMGTLAHDWLARFHQELQSAHLRWRDVDADQAQAMFDIAVAKSKNANPDLLRVPNPAEQWRLDALVAQLRKVVVVLTAWAKSSELDPTLVEVSFGTGQPLPPWRLDLGQGRNLRVRGKVDRVDVYRRPDGGCDFTVVDYKIQGRRYDETLAEAGIDVQITAYLLALEAIPWPLAQATAGSPDPIARAVPIGMFFVGLRGRPMTSDRSTVPVARVLLENENHRHRGRFLAPALLILDRGARQVPSGQYAFRVRKTGDLYRGGDGIPADEYRAHLEAARETLVRLGQGMMNGHFPVSPYRRGSRTACDRCELAAICRFDSWIQPFRGLRPRVTAASGDDQAGNVLIS